MLLFGKKGPLAWFLNVFATATPALVDKGPPGVGTLALRLPLARVES